MRTPAALILGSLLLAGVISCGGGGDGPTGTSTPGAIQGTLTSTVGSPIVNASLQLLKADKSLLRATTTSANGSYAFLDVTPGNYFVRAQPPAGYAISPAADSLRTVQVTSGQTTSVSLTVAGVTQATDTVQAGESDTISLGNGARVVAAVALGAAPLVIEVREGPTDSSTWGRTTHGASVEITTPVMGGIQGGATPRASSGAVTPGVTITFALPVTSQPALPAQAVVRGIFTGPPEATAAGTIRSQATTGQDPLTGATQTVMVGQVTLAPEELTSLQLAVVAATLECPDQFDLTQDAAFTGSVPLLLIHGISLPDPDCEDYGNYDPASGIFKELIAGLKADAAVRSRYALYVFKYPTYAGVANAAAGLDSRYTSTITAQGTKPMTIIAHSMGGLVARQYLNAHNRSSLVSHVITLATPHYGTVLADAGNAALNSEVQTCYERAATPLRPLLRWWLLKVIVTSLLRDGTQGIADLSTGSLLLASPEPHAALFSTFHGEVAINSVNHGLLLPTTNSVMTAAGCYLELRGEVPNDEFVQASSASPLWLNSRDFGAFPRDHIQMADQDAQSVNDNLLPTIIKLLLPQVAWTETFDSYTAGGWPSLWIRDANAADGTQNYIDNAASYRGGQSLRLFGAPNGCWSAIAYRPITVAPPFELEVTIRNGNEVQTGCHLYRGLLQLRKCCTWTNPARQLLTFRRDGAVEAPDGTTLATFTPLVWYTVRIKYERTSSTQVSLSYWVDGQYLGQKMFAAQAEEDLLDHLNLEAGEGAVWFDEVRILH